MKIWLDTHNKKRFTESEAAAIIRDIAYTCDVTVNPVPDGFAMSTRLYPAPSKRWQRVSLSPLSYSETLGRNRLVWAVCWHGHYRFMSEVFARFPNAKIRTSHAVYDGRAQFFTDAESTGDVNRGSQYAPMAFRDACTCQDPGDANPDAYDALSWPENDTRERAAQRKAEACGHVAEYGYHNFAGYHLPLTCLSCGANTEGA